MGRIKHSLKVDTARVDGWTYCVGFEQHEESPRCYETVNHEIVRCKVFLQNRTMKRGGPFHSINAAIVS